MKVAIYQPWIYLHGGLERTLLELVRRSRHEWIVYAGHYNMETTFPGFAEVDVRTLRPTSVDRAVSSVLRSALQVFFQKLPFDSDVDALVVCCDGIGDLITFRNHSLPVFNLCFTPLRAAFDPVYEKKALSARDSWQRIVYHSLKYSFRTVDRRAWRNYRNVIAISEEVKTRIVAGRLFEASRMAVAYPGIDWEPTLANVKYEPFVLMAGRIMWTKNIELAIKAFLEADAPAPWKLVIAGFVDKKSQVYLDALHQVANGSNRIDFILCPPDDVMTDLYRRTSFCLFTPLNEDWGIAPLEAMVHGKPVIAVNSGGPRESIVHGRSGYLLPPVVSDWSSAITELIRNPDMVQGLGRHAHADVKRFTWDRFIAQVDDSIEHWLVADRVAGIKRHVGSGNAIPDWPAKIHSTRNASERQH